MSKHGTSLLSLSADSSHGMSYLQIVLLCQHCCVFAQPTPVKTPEDDTPCLGVMCLRLCVCKLERARHNTSNIMANL